MKRFMELRDILMMKQWLNVGELIAMYLQVSIHITW